MRPLLRLSGILALLGFALGAGEVASPPSPAAAAPAPSPTSTPPPPPPLPVRAASTVESLRQLLAMTEAQRDVELARRSSRQQALIRQELRSLDRLDPAGRENRLRLLELRIIMDPLIKLPPAARASALATLSPYQRDFVESQLESWDALTAEHRAGILATHRGWIPLPPANPRRVTPSVADTPPPLPDPGFRSRVEVDLDRWSALDPREQTNAARALVRFFELPPGDQRAVLARLKPGQRIQVERMVESFGVLDAAARSRAIDAFLRFAALSPDERSRFWRNADRWDSMTPEDRRAWRVLTAHLPPLPPGLGPTQTLPPNPPRVAPARTGTNAQTAR